MSAGTGMWRANVLDRILVFLAGSTGVLQRERKLREELRQRDRMYALTFEKAPFAATLSRLPDGVLVQVNEAFVRTFGYTRDEAVGRTTLDLQINPNVQDRARIVTELQERGTVRDQEMTLHTKSGDACILSVNIDVVDIGGKQYLLTMTQDITERRRAEAAREQARASERVAIQQQLHLRDEAIRELSTPLLQVREGLVLLPLVGAIDAERAQLLTDRLLRRIAGARVRVAVIDVTGVPDLDSTTAKRLTEAVRAAALMGSLVIISGLSGSASKALASLRDVDLGLLQSAGDLQSGLELAEQLLQHGRPLRTALRA